ncbi:MAG: PRC-barrel domain-containing protein [Bacteroidota bacterium]
MATKHAPLSKLHDYELVHPEQDIRGWEVKDATGTSIGRVDDLLVSTDTELVEVIRLEDGQEYPAREIEIGDRAVHLRRKKDPTVGETEPVVKVYDNARVRRRQGTTGATGTTAAAGAGVAAYDDDFRSHYQTTYASSGNDYAYYQPAYHHGYTYATRDEYRSRDWNTAEPEMRRSYEEEHGRGTWDKVKDAARHAFDRGRSSATGSRRT